MRKLAIQNNESAAWSKQLPGMAQRCMWITERGEREPKKDRIEMLRRGIAEQVGMQQVYIPELVLMDALFRNIQHAPR